MKKLRLFVSAGIILSVALTGCQKNISNTAETQPIETEVFRNEGYYFANAGKTISVIYAGRIIEVQQIDNGKFIYDGDIVLDRKDITMPGEITTEGVYAGRTWVNRTVRWRFASGVSQNLITKWTTATQAWTRDLGFVFTKIDADATGDYILVQQNSTGSAYSTSIGRRGGQQIISMDPRYFSAGSMIHEIGHAVGLHHEQKRPDRDNYIIVNYSNIKPGWTSQYDKCVTCKPDGTFDFGSIMLYGPRASSSVVYNTSVPAMTKLDGTIWTTNRLALSSGDKAAIETMY